MKYKIGILDDEPDTIRAFQRDVSDEFEVFVLELQESISEIIDVILKSGIKAFVVDYDLQQKNYNGIELITELNNIMMDFPTFILTAFDDKAEDNIFDVNKIYNKSGPSEILNRRIRKQIETYEQRLIEARAEMIKLLNKPDKLTADEEDNLLILDKLLENSTYKTGSIPNSIKKGLTFDKKIIELLESTEQLLKEVKKP